MKYEKFDIELALAGEPVITRSGAKAYIRHKEEEFEIDYPLTGVVLEDSQRVIGQSWILSGSVYLSDGSDGDIIGMYPKEPLTMPDSFWDMLHPKYKAIAKDIDELWYAYSGKPDKLNKRWSPGIENFINLTDVIQCSYFPDCDWEDSLIMRPAK